MEGWLEGNLMLAERARRMLTRKLEFPMLGIGGWNIEGESWVVKARLAEAFIQLEHGPWVGRQIDRSGTGPGQVEDRSVTCPHRPVGGVNLSRQKISPSTLRRPCRIWPKGRLARDPAGRSKSRHRVLASIPP